MFSLLLESFCLLSLDLYIFLFFNFMFLYFVVFYNKFADKNNKEFMFFFKVFFLLVFLGLIYLTYNFPIKKWMLFDFFLVSDLYSFYFKFLLATFFVVFIYMFIKFEVNFMAYYEYIFILFLTFISLLFLLNVFDFMLFYLVLELASLGLYVLASSGISSIKISEAGLKYFVLGVISSIFFLYGISFIYGAIGSVNFLKIILFSRIDLLFNEFFYNQLLLGILLVMGSLFFKIGVAPFHVWVIDVYSGISLPSFFFFSVFSKFIFVLVFFKLLFLVFFEFGFVFKYILIFFSIISIIVGVYGSFGSVDLRRFLAYGSISHVGFIMLSFSSYTIYGMFAGLFYLIVYAFLMLSFFYVYGFLKSAYPNFTSINELNFIKNSNFFIAIVFSFMLFSMAGIPPFIGFFSKFIVLYGFLNYETFYFVLCLLILILNVVGTFPYIRIVSSLFFDYDNYRFLSLYISPLLVLFFLFNIFGIIFYLFFYKFLFIIIIDLLLCSI